MIRFRGEGEEIRYGLNLYPPSSILLGGVLRLPLPWGQWDFSFHRNTRIPWRETPKRFFGWRFQFFWMTWAEVRQQEIDLAEFNRPRSKEEVMNGG